VSNSDAYELFAQAADVESVRRRIAEQLKPAESDDSHSGYSSSSESDSSGDDGDESPPPRPVLDESDDDEHAAREERVAYHLMHSADAEPLCALTRTNRSYNAPPAGTDAAPQVECFYSSALSDAFLAPLAQRAHWTPSARTALDALAVCESMLERALYNEHNTLYVVVSVSAHYWQPAVAYLAQYMHSERLRPGAAERLVSALYMCGLAAQDTLGKLCASASGGRYANVLCMHFEDSPVLPAERSGGGDLVSSLMNTFYDDYLPTMTRATVERLVDMLCYVGNGAPPQLPLKRPLSCCAARAQLVSRVASPSTHVLDRRGSHRQATVAVGPIYRPALDARTRRVQNILVSEHVEDRLLQVDSAALEDRFGRHFGVDYHDSVYAKATNVSVHAAMPNCARATGDSSGKETPLLAAAASAPALACSATVPKLAGIGCAPTRYGSGALLAPAENSVTVRGVVQPPLVPRTRDESDNDDGSGSGATTDDSGDRVW
jgi:hypothetical protein